jgi:aminoglycoside 6-adenylyltransferase
MRSEKEMFDLIVGVAKKDERIRAVYMNGSRTNPNAPKDKDVAEFFKYIYAVNDDENMTKYLKHVRELPVDANGIYE